MKELQQVNAPATCMVLKNQGIKRNQEIFLDGDGVNLGQPPIEASCIFPDAKVSFGKEWRIHLYCYEHKYMLWAMQTHKMPWLMILMQSAISTYITRHYETLI